MDEHFVKENQKCALGPSGRSREDRISKLPDPLLCHILSYLPTKDAVRTSILSTRWTNLWLLVPVLDLEVCEFHDHDAFVGFVDKFIASHSGCIHKFKVMDYGGDDTSCYVSWIDTVVKQRRIQHLELMLGYEGLRMPLSLYTCETLVCLKLYEVILDCPQFVSLPSLKIMDLEHVEYANDLAFETLILSCSSLEELTIERSVSDNVNVLRVRSKTLRSLSLGFDPVEYDEVHEVVVDAPRLKYLRIVDFRTDIFRINSLDSSATVDLTVTFNERCADISAPNTSPKKNIIRNFLIGISSARNMIVSDETLEVIYCYFRTEPLPRFKNLSCLSATFPSLQMLPALLESCPNLKSFIMKGKDISFEKEQVRFLSEPQCLLSSLEFVDVEIPISWGAEIEVATYFLANSALLKRLTLRSGDSTAKEEENTAILNGLLTLPRRSRASQIVVC